VTHAIVLIEAERSAMPTLGGALADVDGVAEAYSVTGEWDFVAMLRVRDPSRSPRSSRTARAARRDQRTHTMVAFEVFSQHDLEALFSIGELGCPASRARTRPCGPSSRAPSGRFRWRRRPRRRSRAARRSRRGGSAGRGSRAAQLPVVVEGFG
jgi:uncharacterized protein with GYD domain